MEIEAEEQARLEAKIRLASTISPNSSKVSLVPEPSLRVPASAHPKQGNTSIFTCPYCSIVFKYRKVCIEYIGYQIPLSGRVM